MLETKNLEEIMRKNIEALENNPLFSSGGGGANSYGNLNFDEIQMEINKNNSGNERDFEPMTTK